MTKASRVHPYGVVLAREREKAGRSLSEIAERSGVHRSRLHSLEAGRTHRVPTREDRKRIAEALGIDFEAMERAWYSDDAPDDELIPVINRTATGATVDYEAPGFEPLAEPQMLPKLPGISKHAFAVLITSATMAPTLETNDYVIFEPARHATNAVGGMGTVCYVAFAGGAPDVIARLHTTAELSGTLAFDSPARAPISCRLDEVESLSFAVMRLTTKGLHSRPRG